jgi:hypothetical protein
MNMSATSDTAGLWVVQRSTPGGLRLNSTLVWGHALRQSIHRTQFLLSTNWAGWEWRGHPPVSRPSGGSAGPPL